MTAIDEEYAAARFAALSDAELAAVVEDQRDDYTERALELATAELQRRRADPGRAAAEETERQGAIPRRARQGERWLDLYVALLGMYAVGAPVLHLVVLGTPISWVAFIQLPISLLQGAVAYGLKQRRAWAWYLNWVALFAGLINGSGLGLIPMVLYGIYFARRRRWFESASSTP